MTDYTGPNSKKAKAAAVPEKKVEKVVTGTVVVKKKPLSQKFKDVFIEMDLRSVTRYVISDVLIPAARNMIVDASTKGIERMMYGERASRSRSVVGSGPRMSYSGSPMHRMDYRAPSRGPMRPDPRTSSTQRATQNDIILETKVEADLVLEKMYDIFEMYEVVSLADFNELLGLPSNFVDRSWGWTNLAGSNVITVHQGFMIDLPPIEPI